MRFCDVIAMALIVGLSLLWIRQEVAEDHRQIRKHGDDDHRTDVVEAFILCLLVTIFGYFNRIFFATAPVYFGLRALLFDYWLNRRMGWPLYHFRNKGFDRVFYGKPPWYVWTVKGAIALVGIAIMITIALI
jgi:hypothetical protein